MSLAASFHLLALRGLPGWLEQVRSPIVDLESRLTVEAAVWRQSLWRRVGACVIGSGRVFGDGSSSRQWGCLEGLPGTTHPLAHL